MQASSAGPADDVAAERALMVRSDVRAELPYPPLTHSPEQAKLPIRADTTPVLTSSDLL